MRYLFLLVVVFCCVNCRVPQKQPKAPAIVEQAGLRIIRSLNMNDLPSASGITRYDDLFLINPDNAPFLYVIDSNGQLQDSLALLNENPSLHQIPKPVKPDYEAATLIDWNNTHWLVLLGSGSMSPHRDSALIIRPGEPLQQRKASLRPFYDALIRSGIPGKSLNIEAIANSARQLYIFNRGTNQMISLATGSFAAWLFHGERLPAFRLAPVALPAVNGYAPGISGATMADDSTILFCASVEATTDWTKDGEVIGSGIGVLRIPAAGVPELLQWDMLRDSTGELVREKLEGLEVLHRNGESVMLRCVSDNDNGSSGLFDLELRLRDKVSAHQEQPRQPLRSARHRCRR